MPEDERKAADIVDTNILYQASSKLIVCFFLTGWLA
jgi:hypothetical protein